MLDLDDSILINQWVQNVRTDSELLTWFDTQTEECKETIRKEVRGLVQQAKYVLDDGSVAIKESQLNPRRSACVILAKGATHETLHKLTCLRNNDGKDAFILLLYLLRTADTRRRESEKETKCNHWWHRDLSDPKVLSEVLERYKNGTL